MIFGIEFFIDLIELLYSWICYKEVSLQTKFRKILIIS